MILLALASCVIAQSPGQLQFSQPSAPLSKVLAALSKQTQTKLKADASIAPQVVFVEVNGVTLAELKSQIAKAADARWMPDGDTDVLRRTPTLRDRIYQDHLDKRLAALDVELKRLKAQIDLPFDAKAYLADVKRQASKPEPNNMDDARLNERRARAVRENSPTARLLIRLILACKPADLVSNDVYQRSFCSPNPTKIQHPINASAFDNAMEAFRKEQTDWIDAAGNLERGQLGNTVSDPTGQTRPAGQVKVTGIELHQLPGAGLFYANLIQQDDKVQDILCQMSVESRGQMDRMLAKDPTLAKKDPLVALSPNSKLFADRYREVYDEGSVEAPSDKVSELIANPDLYDPLSFGWPEILQSYSKLYKLNIVASLPDDCAGNFWGRAKTTEIGTDSTLDRMVRVGTLSIEKGERWAIVKPYDRFDSEQSNTSRTALAGLMKSIRDKGVLDVRNFAKFAFNQGLSRGRIYSMYQTLLDRSASNGVEVRDWNALRLFGSFSDTARDRLEQGGNVHFATMNPAQLQIVAQILYSGVVANETIVSSHSYKMNGTPVEPTQTFGDGMLLNGEIETRFQNTPTIFAYATSKGGKARPGHANEPFGVASSIVSAESDPSKSQSNGITTYAPGQQKLIIFKLWFAPAIWKEIGITVNDYDPKAQPVAWEKLPDPIPAQISRAMDQLRASRKQSGKG